MWGRRNAEGSMRFYVSPESIFLDRNIIEVKDMGEVHHIRDVMRLKKGNAVDVFDGVSKEYSGAIKEIGKNLVVIEIKGQREVKSKPPYNATLYQAIPKKGKMDFIIEKAVELGIDRIVPVVTERTIVAPIKAKSDRKVARWRNIARSASKQCGRVKLPAISDMVRFNNALLEAEKNDLVIFAALDREARPLREILKGFEPKTIAIFVGPEGDFSQKEIAAAKGQGSIIASLGAPVLRVETAAIYILSCLNYEYSKTYEDY